MERALPGPRKISPIDLLRSLPNPSPFFEGLAREHGDTFLVPTFLGPVVFTRDTEAIRALYTADPDMFEVFGADMGKTFFGETALVLVSGARHKRDRKLLTPPFHGARMRAYGGIITDIAAREAARFRPGVPFDVLRSTQTVSLDVIVRTVFGVEEERQIEEFRAAILEFIKRMVTSIILFNFTRHEFGGFGPWARFRRASTRLDTLLFNKIAERRKSAEPREDILSLMMQARYDDGSAMSDVELRNELLTLLFAGHETTAIALAWALYWIHRTPGVLTRVLAEINSVGEGPEPDAYAALPYLDAVCQETLRISPVVVDITRHLRRPMQLSGFTVPAGMGVCPSVVMVHRREDIYPEPDRFRPERFLERKFSPFEYIPFGGGGRRCLGAAFAMYEMKIVLATWLRAHRMRLATHKPVEPRRRGLTIGPGGGVFMAVDGSRRA